MSYPGAPQPHDPWASEAPPGGASPTPDLSRGQPQQDWSSAPSAYPTGGNPGAVAPYPGGAYGPQPSPQPYGQQPYGQVPYPQQPYPQAQPPQPAYGQQPYPQVGYGQQPYHPYGQPPRSSGAPVFSIIAFICAPIALVFCPFLFGPAGIVLGVVGNSKGEALGKWAAGVSGVMMALGLVVNLVIRRWIGL